MSPPRSRLSCSGCGAAPAAGDPYPFRCPNAGEGDIDHVLSKVVDQAAVHFPWGPAEGGPFVRYRALLHSYHRAMAGGLTDAAFTDLVQHLDSQVARVAGHGFGVTPFRRNGRLSEALGFEKGGGVWVKDETHNVAGSHKGRHLFGVLLHLEVSERLGLASKVNRPVLAIASCGNAALAAGVVAAAGGWRLRVFVPAGAGGKVREALTGLGADVLSCPREREAAGDPTYARVREEIALGALPFTCQGNENGLAIEGGETLTYEVVSELRTAGVALDHVVVQVGGGALASSCAQALTAAANLGAMENAPRLHTVQTGGAHPLERAHRRVVRALPAHPGPRDFDRALKEAASHRSAYMWPWASEPKSIATGIVDDEAYDWLAVVGGMLKTGGRPVVVSEERLAQANRLGREAGFCVDPTGTAGLAGLAELRAEDIVRAHEKAAVLFTGVDRGNG